MLLRTLGGRLISRFGDQALLNWPRDMTNLTVASPTPCHLLDSDFCKYSASTPFLRSISAWNIRLPRCIFTLSISLTANSSALLYLLQVHFWGKGWLTMLHRIAHLTLLIHFYGLYLEISVYSPIYAQIFSSEARHSVFEYPHGGFLLRHFAVIPDRNHSSYF